MVRQLKEREREREREREKEKEDNMKKRVGLKNKERKRAL